VKTFFFRGGFHFSKLGQRLALKKWAL